MSTPPHTLAFRHPIAMQKRSTTVRSLRRRLWKALQDEDIETALRAYTASKRDFQAWEEEETLEEERRLQWEEDERQVNKQLRHRSRPLALRKLSGLGKSMRKSIRNLEPNNKKSTERRDHDHGQRRRRSTDLRCSDALPLEYPFCSNGDFPLSILQLNMSPSEPFEFDDFLSHTDEYADFEPPPLVIPASTKFSKQRKKTGPRIAGFWNRSSATDWDLSDSKSDDDMGTTKTNQNMTTPLHEAARLGNPSLLSLMLQRGGNPNARNGKQQTSLHMVAGGVTKIEELKMKFNHCESVDVIRPDLGMLAPKSTVEGDEVSDFDDDQPVKRAARAMSKLWKTMNKDSKKVDEIVEKETCLTVPKFSDLQTQEAARMDSLFTILAWSHPVDDSPSSGEGPSINSVDARGRTALHYAAELGRNDVCMTILSSFGVILTVVDEFGQTPCELAGNQGHSYLASQLEARALLYMDPYGMDDELMITILTGSTMASSGRKSLALPFSWFSTLTMEDVNVEREKRITNCLHRMKDILRRLQQDTEITDFMLNQYIDDSMDGSLAVYKSENDTTYDKYEDEEIALEITPNKKPAVENRDGCGEYCNDQELTDVHMNSKLSATFVREGERRSSQNAAIIDAIDPGLKELLSFEIDRKASASARTGNVAYSENGDKAVSIKDTKVSSNDTRGDPGGFFSDSKGTTPSVAEYSYAMEFLKKTHVERFLASAKWNVEEALAGFEEDPLRLMEKLGIIITHDRHRENQTTGEVNTMCLICCDEYSIHSPNWITLKGCQHSFCSFCLGDYIAESARTKETGIYIECPHHNCAVPLDPVEVEVLATSPEILQSLTRAANENFIAAASELCFCPHPGCEGVVRKHAPQFLISSSLDQDIMDYVGATCTAVSKTNDDIVQLTYEGVHDDNYKMTRKAVQPIKAHRFCFVCGDTKIHWPVPCDALNQWKETIDEEVGALDNVEDTGTTGHEFDDLAQRLWMKANTRPCPKCKCPIEKNDGCNHMTCSNRLCRHEFCWICREDWKLHNTDTGGFFKCNRWQGDDKHQYYDAPPEKRTPQSTTETVSDPSTLPVLALQNSNDQNGYGTAQHSSRIAWKKAKEMDRFLHHYRRWTAHSESAMLERNMADTVCARLAPVVEAAVEFNGRKDFDFNGKGLSFVHDAFTELLESRSLLQHSYAFAFFRYPTFELVRRSRAMKIREREKMGFEQLQSELEMLTEQMSDIVARKHLRATQVQIMFLTNETCQKRSELTSLMLTLLHQQRKDAKDEVHEQEEQKKQQAKDSASFSLPDFLDFSDPFGNVSGGHDQIPSQLRRLMESHQRRVTAYGDSDDEDDYLIFPNRMRMLQRDEESMQLAMRASVTAYQNRTEPTVAENDGPLFSDWPCGVCTYMNAGGQHCAMCGGPKRN